jgi:hypothetical protein
MFSCFHRWPKNPQQRPSSMQPRALYLERLENRRLLNADPAISNVAEPRVAIVVDPSDPSGNTLHVSGASGGVWKTIDFGSTRQLAVDPNNPHHEQFENTFLGGVLVAAGDVNGDGSADIITARGSGEPELRVVDGASGSELSSFFAYPPRFAGGVHVAAGDFDGDGHADIITAPAAGAGPHVKVFDAATLQAIDSFFAFAATPDKGLFIAESS